MTVNMIVCAVLTALGLLFMIASLVGIAKLPDFFTRLHAQGVGDTIGAFLILAGMTAAAWGGLLPVKILLIFIVIVLTNPIGTNLMMIAAINKEDYLGYRTKMSGEKKAVSEAEPNVTSEPENMAVSESDNMAASEPENMAVSEPENVAASEPDKITEEEASAPADRPENQDKSGTDTHESEKPAKSARRRRSRSKSKSKSKSADTDASKDRTEDNTKDKTKDKSRSNTRKNTKNKSEDKGSKNNRRRKPKPSMKMNKAELIKEAESRGIKVSDKATKREILDLIYSKTTD